MKDIVNVYMYIYIVNEICKNKVRDDLFECTSTKLESWKNIYFFWDTVDSKVRNIMFSRFQFIIIYAFHLL